MSSERWEVKESDNDGTDEDDIDMRSEVGCMCLDSGGKGVFRTLLFKFSCLFVKKRGRKKTKIFLMKKDVTHHGL